MPPKMKAKKKPAKKKCSLCKDFRNDPELGPVCRKNPGWRQVDTESECIDQDG